MGGGLSFEVGGFVQRTVIILAFLLRGLRFKGGRGKGGRRHSSLLYIPKQWRDKGVRETREDTVQRPPLPTRAGAWAIQHGQEEDADQAHDGLGGAVGKGASRVVGGGEGASLRIIVTAQEGRGGYRGDAERKSSCCRRHDLCGGQLLGHQNVAEHLAERISK